MFSLALKLFEVTMVENLSHFVHFFKIMVSFFSIFAFTRLNKMGFWNANIVICNSNVAFFDAAVRIHHVRSSNRDTPLLTINTLTRTNRSTPLRHSNRHIAPLVKLHDYVCSHIYSDQSFSLISGPTKGTRYPPANYVSYHRYKPAYRSFVTQHSVVTEPRSYSEAPAHLEWQEAMHSELHALQANDTWSLTPLSAGKTPISCR